MKTEVCSICGTEMELLEAPTGRQALPVFVCKNEKKNHAGFSVHGMPCDGYCYDIAQANAQRR